MSPKPRGVHQVSTQVKLPKISVPMFDGNIMNWSSFFEHFEVSVHNKEILKDFYKLVYMYLREVLNNRSTKQVI